MTAGWLPVALLAGVAITAAPAGRTHAAARTRAHAPTRTEVETSAPARATHEFHVSYTRMAVEPTVISAQIRVFADDVTRALVERTKAQSITLNSPQGEAAFQAYLAAGFPVKANGRLLSPVVASSVQDREMWSYVVTWTSPTPITTVSMHNAALFELFDDQQNIVKVKHLASGREATQFYSGGSRADQVFRF